MSDRTIGNGTLKQHRWVVNEPQIPFLCEQLHCDDDLMVVDKPHFLASMPRGMWYRQTALIQMREKTGNEELSLAHRLDRATAGVLVLTMHRSVRGTYQKLFESRDVHKMYECVASNRLARALASPEQSELLVHQLNIDGLHRAELVPVVECGAVRGLGLQLSSHIEKTVGVFQAAECELAAEGNAINATTVIAAKPDAQLSAHEWEMLAGNPHLAIYQLWPRTGKTHQLRVHMNALGCPIMGDDLYPEVLDRAYDDFSSPLELVARSLQFTDPLTGQERVFISRIEL